MAVFKVCYKILKLGNREANFRVSNFLKYQVESLL